MLKHPDLTRRRINLFLQQELKPRLYGYRHGLRIQFSDAQVHTQVEAEQGEWKEVGRGFEYGPAYRSFWFRVSGVVPPELAGKAVVLIAEVGGERTLWKDNSPWGGMDIEHSDFGWLEGHAMTAHGPRPVGGEPVEYLIEATTRNPQVRVHGKEPAREPLVEKVERAELVEVDLEVRDLIFDIEFTLSLLETIDEKDPAFSTILRALNDIVNLFAAEGRAILPRARRVIQDALGSLNGELKHTIVPVGHAHLDTAWLWPLSVTRKKMAHTTATQLQLLDKYPEYVFVHSQASQYEWIEQEYPALFERVRAAVDRGQWEPVGSMWVEADCNLTGAESLIRQFLYGRRYFRQKLGYETQDMWLPDVFGYSAAIPQILAKFNIKYFLTQKISWNQFNKFPHHTFWWQGIDGTRIWSHFPPADTYNASAEPKEVVYSVKNFKDQARSDTSLYVFGFGDGGGGPTERHLEFLKRGRFAPNYPDVALGKKAVDFFREAKARSKDLITWVGELYLELHRGTYTTQAANKRNNRKCEFLLRDAEWLACFAPTFPASYPKEALEAAWKLVLLNQFHDIIPGSSVKEVYEDSDRDYAEVQIACEKVIQDSLVALGSALETSDMVRPAAIFHNGNMVTEASIPWDHEQVPTALECGEQVLPVQLVEALGERKLIFATPHSSLGAVTVGDFVEGVQPHKERLKTSTSNRRIENGELSVRFDSQGNISSISSLEDGSEFVEPGKVANVFQLLDDKPLFWSAWDVDLFSFETAQDLMKSESFEIVERGPVRVAVEIVKRFGKSRIRQRISLGPTPGIRFDTEVDWQEEDKLLKVAFPVNVNSNRATYEIQFGHVERPTHMNTSWDMAKFEVCAQKWVDLSEGDQGVSLINDGKYGHDIHGNVIRLSLLRAPQAPDPTCDIGIHRFSYCLVPHFGPFQYANIVQAAYTFNAQTRLAWLNPTPGQRGTLPPFVSCDDRNIIVESIKKAEDSAEIIVRLYECHNARGRAELIGALPLQYAALCDLEENEIAQLSVNGHSVSFDYKPFEIITLKLRL